MFLYTLLSLITNSILFYLFCKVVIFLYGFCMEENNKHEIQGSPKEKVEKENIEMHRQMVQEHLDDIWESRNEAIANGSYMCYTSKKGWSKKPY